MKPRPLIPALFALLTTCAAFAQTAAPASPEAAPKKAAAKTPAVPQSPDVAAPKMGTDGQPQPPFMKAHEGFVAIAKAGQAKLLFLGDSITAGWGGQKAIWDTAFGAYKPANFGIGGDRTQHVLWRIENGELEGFKPKVAVIMIGTNNSASDTAEGIAKGITKIVETVHKKSPNTKVLLLAVFPRGDKQTGALNAQHEKLKEVNSTISKLHDGKKVFFLDIGSKFLAADGTLPKEVMPDFLHLSPKGYQIWADAISPKLAELMK